MSSAVCLVATYALNAAWQLPLIAIAGWAGARILGGPRAQHLVWVATLLLGVVTPMLTGISLPMLSTATAGQAAVVIGTAGAGGTVSTEALALPRAGVWLISGMYGCAMLFFAARLLSSLLGVRHLIRESDPVALTGEREALWNRACAAFGVSRVRLFSSSEVNGIATTGARRPAILLPAGFERWEDDDLLSAVGHELAHIRRADFGWNLLYEVATLLTDFHPVTWLVKTQILRTREMICDAMVVEKLVARKLYRQSLLRLAERMAAGPRTALHAIGMFDANILEERIMRMRSKRVPPGPWIRCGLAACAAAMLLTAVAGGTAFARDVTAPNESLQAQDAAHAAAPENSRGTASAKNTAAGTGQQGRETVYRPGPDVKNPVLTFAPDPVFPKSARVPAGTNVVCIVSVVVDRNGMPQNVHAERSAGTAFDRNAMQAVRRYRFRPALRDGRPVAVAIRVEVNFRKY